ncbi:phorbol ester/diacylglycerol-binding protein unc-13-like [Macrosteles quadrilineatus]|uniref:phorbol ester/diacylglycerol-binding protein unc-13-like n=1 Tax=Macrosteles quadrilineatus TaxID=74068 RepID=UPI0023E0F5FC|nr:phorbol ester/diacylglycerol-binding protein unc-13-like [Macrosteles quadrilineatus]
MSLLSVTVKKARYFGAQAAQNDSYVTLKLQNVKSTTVTVKGANPCWEQDFLFETNDVNTGLLIEVWSKGMIWDRALGYHFLPLPSVHYSSEEGPGEWVSLDAELVMMEGEVVGTKNPTGHSLLVDCRFELPFGRYDPPTGWRDLLGVCGPISQRNSRDPENTEAADLQRKLEYLNSIVDQEQRAEQARRQMQYFGHSGYSEDSDYTSDLNYPVGQHANSSASQFRSTAHQMSTPQRSLETSRENSYETDEPPSQPPPVHHGHHLAPGPQHPSRRRTQRGEDLYNTYSGDGSRNYNDHEDPLSYNSRPRNYKEPSRRRKKTWDYEDSQTTWYEDGYTESFETPENTRIYPPQQYNTPVTRATPNKRNKGPNTNRRPSLERQTTLYDDPYNSYEEKYYDADAYPQTDSTSYNQGQNYNQDYYNSTNYGYQDDSRYGQEEEDRQWDSGGGGGGQGQDYYYSNYYRQNRYENKINRSRTKRSSSNRELTRGFSESMDDDVYYSTQQSYEDENYQVRNDFSGSTARRKQFNSSRSQSMSQQINDDYDPDFPPPRSRNKPKKLPQIPVKIKPSPSLPPTPVKTQQHKPAKRTGSLEYQEPQEEVNYYQDTRNKQIDYNEDYNYAYQSTDNLIPTQPEVIIPSNQYKDTVTSRVTNQQAYQDAYQDTNQQVYERNNQQSYQAINQQGYQTNQQAYSTQNQQGYQTTNQQNYQTTDQQAYPTINQQGYQEPTYNYYGEKPPTVQVQRPEEDQQTLSRRDTLKKQFQGRQRLESPRIFQQNTDSLESKDDDLRDSFETAMSSVSAQGHQSFNSEYTPVPEPNTMTDKLDRYNNVSRKKTIDIPIQYKKKIY